MPRRYAVLDVFAATPLEGNPLAVVLDADGLSAEEMQRIAGEFNLSETVFVLPAENPIHTARLRIFTAKAELRFAGHPTVGSAVLLASERAARATGDGIVILEEGIGPVRCGVTLHEGGGHAIFDAPRLPTALSRPLDETLIAAALGLDPDDIGFENHIPSAYDAGLGFIFVPIHNRATIAAAAPQLAVWADAFGQTAGYIYTRDTEVVGRQFHARMFAPGLGVAEDPATGSAAVAFAAVAHRFDAHPAGTHSLIIEQGFEMGRPSLLNLEVDIEVDGVKAIRLGGEAVVIARGELLV